MFEGIALTIPVAFLGAIMAANNDDRFGGVERLLYALGFFVGAMFLSWLVAVKEEKGKTAFVAAVAYFPIFAIAAIIVKLS